MTMLLYGRLRQGAPQLLLITGLLLSACSGSRSLPLRRQQEAEADTLQEIQMSEKQLKKPVFDTTPVRLQPGRR